MSRRALIWSWVGLVVFAIAVAIGVFVEVRSRQSPAVLVLEEPPLAATAADEDRPAEKKAAPANPDGILYWTCPMHPDVRSASPGKHNVPGCGMDLVPVR